MDQEDPISQFFPDQDEVDLYEVLSAPKDAKLEGIKKAYRRLALIYHPDKHVTASDAAKAEASTNFQQVGFAYAVLSDEKRRARYDKTGKTDEGFDLAAGDDGWDAYFEEIFERVTRGKLDELKKEYQGWLPTRSDLNVLMSPSGSAEEINDLKMVYRNTGGSIGDIMTHMPHSTHEDEARFIVLISDLITEDALPILDTWQTSVKDEKAKLVRQKQGQKEAQEAEKLAKELGVWDEFYGSGNQGERKGKGKGKKKEADDDEDDEDHSVLQALILKKKQKNMNNFFDSLAAKYSEPQPEGKGRKRGRVVEAEEEEVSLKKKLRKGAPQMPEIDDAEFEKLQAKLFGDKAKATQVTLGSPQAKSKKAKRKGK